MTEPTDTGLIIGHPFTPGRPPLRPDECGYDECSCSDSDCLPCGYARNDHADRGTEVPR